MIWDGLPSAAIWLFSLLLAAELSAGKVTFSAETLGCDQSSPTTEQRKPWLFRRCFSLFCAKTASARNVQRPNDARRSI